MDFTYKGVVFLDLSKTSVNPKRFLYFGSVKMEEYNRCQTVVTITWHQTSDLCCILTKEQERAIIYYNFFGSFYFICFLQYIVSTIFKLLLDYKHTFWVTFFKHNKTLHLYHDNVSRYLLKLKPRSLMWRRKMPICTKP